MDSDRLTSSSSTSSSKCTRGETLDLLTGSPIFVKPKKPLKKTTKLKGSPEQGTSDSFQENVAFTGTTMMCLDDGRESLGILPQFKNPAHVTSMENPETFLIGDTGDFTGRPSLFDEGRESLGILPQFKDNARHLFNTEHDDSFLVSIEEVEEESILEKAINEKQCSWTEQFNKDCQAIENDTFLPVDEKDTTDENYSVYAEANFLAAKIADNSILDISQEGTILDKTPQPEFIEDVDVSIHLQDAKVDTNTIHKQLDIMVPPSQEKKPIGITATPLKAEKSTDCIREPNAYKNDYREADIPENGRHLSIGQQLINEVLHKGAIQNIPEIIILLSAISNQHNCSRVRSILETATNDLVNLDAFHAQNRQREYRDDSGRSSAENDKHLHISNAVLDLSLKSTTSSASTFAQALDLSFCKEEDVPRRLSITFSHNNDPGLPIKPPSNNLRQQTMYMRPLWGSNCTTTYSTYSSDCSSLYSNESRGSSNGSMKVKLKPKKSEQELFRRGPLRAVVPLTCLNTNLMMEQTNSVSMAMAPAPMPSGKPHPNANKTPKPVAQSTPEDGGLPRKKTVCPLASPLARPTRTTPLANRTRRITDLNRSNSMDLPSKQVAQKCSTKTLIRGKSAAELKPAPNPCGGSKAPLRRAFSVGGKENLSAQRSHKQAVNANGSQGNGGQNHSKLPQKSFGMKPFNLVEKLKKTK